MIDRHRCVLEADDAYPLLIHCKAGLHRTGVLAAVYRMERQGWTPLQAYTEAYDSDWLTEVRKVGAENYYPPLEL